MHATRLAAGHELTMASTAAGDDFRDWSGLPEDLLLTAMEAMQLPDLVHSGAVCRSWHSAFATFRRLGLRSPPHPPCLLYAAAAAADNAVRLYSPSSTGAHFRVPLLDEEAASGVVGSAHGWLFTSDRDANPYLLNPLTGARAALPPATALGRVRGRRFVFSPGDGGRRGVTYDVDFGRRPGGSPDVRQVMARRARRWMYRRVAMSASPSAATGCVVLLLHMPERELSFARPGDERWTPLVDGGVWASHGTSFLDAVHNPGDGLFYVLQDSSPGGDTVVHSLDLTAPPPPPSSPVATMLMFATPPRPFNHHLKKTMCRYLAITPQHPQHVAGGLEFLVVERRWRRSGSDDDVSTTEMYVVMLRPLDLYFYEQVSLPGGVGGDLALFVGHAGAACLRVEDYPMFRGNCAYLTDESDGDGDHANPPPWKRLDLALWEFGGSNYRGRLTKLRDTWPLHHPWQDNSPPPIWFTPSLD